MQWDCYVGSAVVCFKIVKKDQSDGKLVLSYSFNGPPSFGARCNIPHSKTKGLAGAVVAAEYKCRTTMVCIQTT
jgi:hypothetical protein